MELVTKLRLYAMVMRLKELQQERIMKVFLPEPIVLTLNKESFTDQKLYNPNLYENQSSKFIGKPKNNFKRK